MEAARPSQCAQRPIHLCCQHVVLLTAQGAWLLRRLLVSGRRPPSLLRVEMADPGAPPRRLSGFDAHTRAPGKRWKTRRARAAARIPRAGGSGVASTVLLRAEERVCIRQR